MAQEKDIFWINQALKLAEKGLFGASPNPLVGCVIVKDDQVLGQGYHAKYGSAHAEVNALRQAGLRARGATLYVTLEPCCHWGKTPPCTQAIIKAGIARVVYSLQDPNPQVRGKGAKELRKNGLEVVSGICQKQAAELNRAFIKYIQKKLPYIILKSAMSLDGKIASVTGEASWISGTSSRKLGHRLRAQVDGILVGAETVRKDNPLLTSHGFDRNPVRLVLSASGQLDKNSQVLKNAAPTWIFHQNKKIGNAQQKNVRWIYFEDLSAKKLAQYCAQNQISKILLEGGGTISASFLESGLVDELYIFVAPILIGGQNAKTFFEGAGIKKIKNAITLKDYTVLPSGKDFLIRARVVKKD